MRAYSCKGLNNREVLEKLSSKLAQNRGNTAEILALIAEAESRRLFVPAGYPSMYEYCVGELHMSEHEALLRIRAARAARQYPAIFGAIAEGRLHLTAVVLLKPCLTRDNAHELIAAATHKTKVEVELLLAQRFPGRDMPSRIRALGPPAASPVGQLVPERVMNGVASGELVPERVMNGVASERVANEVASGELVPERVTNGVASGELVPERVMNGVASGELVPERVTNGVASERVTNGEPFPRIKPLSPQRFGVQFTIDQATHDDLRCVQALLGHQVSSGDLAQVFSRALKSLRKELERTKFAATDRPQTKPRPATKKRTIPAHVKRAVRERDGDQCSFVGTSGKRCPAHSRLEFDHIEAVARGGESTLENLRLRCRAHNQYEAEQVFGDGFMHQKREAARSVAQAWHPV